VEGPNGRWFGTCGIPPVDSHPSDEDLPLGTPAHAVDGARCMFTCERSEKHTSGAEAPVHLIDFKPGINPRPTARISGLCGLPPIEQRAARWMGHPAQCICAATMEGPGNGDRLRSQLPLSRHRDTRRHWRWLPEFLSDWSRDSEPSGCFPWCQARLKVES